MLSANTLPNNGNMMDLISLMADPEKFQKRTEEMRALQEALDKKIALAGKADEILRIRGVIEVELQKTVSARQKAELEAQGILDAALKNAQAQEAESKKRVQAADAQAQALFVKTQADAKALQEHVAEQLSARDAALNTQAAALEKLRAQLAAQATELNTAQSRLNQFRFNYEQDTKQLNSAKAQLEAEKIALAQRLARLQQSWDSFTKQVI